MKDIKRNCEGFHWFSKPATGILEKTLVTTERHAVCDKHREMYTKQHEEFAFHHPSYAGELKFIPYD